MADDPTTTADAEARENEHEASSPAEPETVHGAPVAYSRGQRVLHPSRDSYLDLVSALHADGFLTCLDVTAVDYLTHPGRELPASIAPERFEVVVGLLSHRLRQRVRIRVQVPESDPTMPSLFALHPGTEAMEREVFDTFGIEFDDHPDLTRILMPEDWEGFPLRKDYDSGRIPVQFKGTVSRP
jgi:NADH-quinone oxidoreductase subunit C